MYRLEKMYNRLSERLMMPVGIMGRHPFKPLGTIVCCCDTLWGFLGWPSILEAAHDVERDSSLSDSIARENEKILSNQTEIRLYLPFSAWIGQQTDNVRLLFQINRKMVDTILFRFDLIRFLCVWILFFSQFNIYD